MKNSQGFSVVEIVVAVVVIAILGAGGFLLLNKHSSEISSNTQSSASSPSATPKPQPQQIFAFIRNSNVWASIDGHQRQLTADGTPDIYPNPEPDPSIRYWDLHLSPDGKQLVYRRSESNMAGGLTTKESIKLQPTDIGSAKSILSEVPPNIQTIRWSPDSKDLIFEQVPMDDSVTQYRKFDLSSNTVVNLGSYSGDTGGCGGATDDPAAMAYGQSITPMYHDNLAITPDQVLILHNIDCSGWGVRILNLKTKADHILDDKIAMSTISPDGRTLAGIKDSSIVLFDMQSLKLLRIIPTSTRPSIVDWADNQTLYYEVQTKIRTITVPDDIAMKNYGGTAETTVRKSELWRVGIDGGNQTKIDDFDAFGVNYLGITNDSNKIMIVTTANATELMAAIEKGPVKNSTALFPRASVQLFDLTTKTSTPILSGIDGIQYALRTN